MNENKIQERYGHLFDSSILGDKMNAYNDSVESMSFEVGGNVNGNNGPQNTAARGGLAVGRAHSEGGIKGINKSTGQPLEFEGGEVIITKPAVESQEKKEFEGEMLTNREILSKMNYEAGGVKFEDGGEIEEFYYTGRKYAYGGETIEDYKIINMLQSEYDERDISPIFKKLLKNLRNGN